MQQQGAAENTNAQGEESTEQSSSRKEHITGIMAQKIVILICFDYDRLRYTMFLGKDQEDQSLKAPNSLKAKRDPNKTLRYYKLKVASENV